MDKEVTVNFSTLQSSEKKVLTPEEALKELKRQNENGMWAFVDGKIADIDQLDADDLLNAEDITLMYEIQGGKN